MLFYVGATINAVLKHQHNEHEHRQIGGFSRNEKLNLFEAQNTFTWAQVPTRHKTIGCVLVCLYVCVFGCSIVFSITLFFLSDWKRMKNELKWKPIRLHVMTSICFVQRLLLLLLLLGLFLFYFSIRAVVQGFFLSSNNLHKFIFCVTCSLLYCWISVVLYWSWNAMVI